MSTLYGYDSLAYNRIPKSAKVVFPYADGNGAWAHLAPELFPHAKHRAITRNGEWERASIIDIEPGCVWPYNDGRLKEFVIKRNLKNGDATVYCTRAMVEPIGAYLKGHPFKLFLATLDGSKPKTIHGYHCSAVQFYNEPSQAYDKSIIYDVDWINHHKGKKEWWK